jgi:predicted anti-sigma-YlaC factor YlaD
MSRHLSHKQLIDYLDGALDAGDSRAAWEHVQDCNRCRSHLRQEEDIRRDLRREFTAMRTPDLANLLPGILTEAKQPEALSLNRMAVVLVLVAIIVTLLPAFEFSNLDANPNILNVPISTSTQTEGEMSRNSQRVTDEAPRLTPEPLREGLSVGYASPAPPPQVTEEQKIKN